MAWPLASSLLLLLLLLLSPAASVTIESTLSLGLAPTTQGTVFNVLYDLTDLEDGSGSYVVTGRINGVTPPRAGMIPTTHILGGRKRRWW